MHWYKHCFDWNFNARLFLFMFTSCFFIQNILKITSNLFNDVTKYKISSTWSFKCIFIDVICVNACFVKSSTNFKLILFVIVIVNIRCFLINLTFTNFLTNVFVFIINIILINFSSVHIWASKSNWWFTINSKNEKVIKKTNWCWHWLFSIDRFVCALFLILFESDLVQKLLIFRR